MTRGRGIRTSGKLYPPPPATLEREERLPVTIQSWVVVQGHRHSVELCDLSEHGFGARSPSSIPIGSEISVWLPGSGEVQAQVRWALGGQFGAKFVHPGNRRVDGKMLRATLPALMADQA